MPKKRVRETYISGNVEKLTQIGKVEGNVTVQAVMPNAIKYDESIAQARKLLAVAAYPQARDVLNEYLRMYPVDEQAHLLHALASLAGQYADQFDKVEIRAIENHLQVARAEPMLTTYYVATVALAVIRQDYYGTRCLAAPHLPRFEELVNEIRNMTPSPMDFELLKHLKATMKVRNALSLELMPS